MIGTAYYGKMPYYTNLPLLHRRSSIKEDATLSVVSKLQRSQKTVPSATTTTITTKIPPLVFPLCYDVETN